MGALGVARQTGLVSPLSAVYRQRTVGVAVSDYLNLLLRTAPYVDDYNRRSTGIHSSRLRLYPDQFLNILVVLPTANEQQGIVGEVASIEERVSRMRAKHEREIDLIQEYRTRLISDVVTGKLDVRGVELGELPDFEEIPEVDEPDDDNDDVPAGTGDVHDNV